MGPLSYFIAFVCIAIGLYYWYTNSQLKSAVNDSSRLDSSSAPKSSRKFLDFDEDCKIRSLVPSDLESVRRLAKSKGGCQYFLNKSLKPFLNESDKKCLGFGVEDKRTKTIICTQFIEMVDNDETGLVLGAMMEPQFEANSRIVYMRLSNFVQAQLTVMYEELARHRCIEMPNNTSYLNNAALDWKVKFNLGAMRGNNSEYCLFTDECASDKDDADGVKVNGFEEVKEVSEIVDLLQDKFGVDDVLFDDKIYKTKYMESVLKQASVSTLVNYDKTCVCLVYGDTDYYIYGVQAKDVLSAIRFARSRSADSTAFGIYVSKPMIESNEELKKVFGVAIDNTVFCLDYDMAIDGH